MKCLKKFSNESLYNKHFKECGQNNHNITMPTEDNNILKYKSNGAELHHPYLLIFDMECTLKKSENLKINKNTKS